MAIHVSHTTYDKLKNTTKFHCFGERDFKGKGVMQTYIAEVGNFAEALRKRDELASATGTRTRTGKNSCDATPAPRIQAKGSLISVSRSRRESFASPGSVSRPSSAENVPHNGQYRRPSGLAPLSLVCQSADADEKDNEDSDEVDVDRSSPNARGAREAPGQVRLPQRFVRFRFEKCRSHLDQQIQWSVVGKMLVPVVLSRRPSQSTVPDDGYHRTYVVIVKAVATTVLTCTAACTYVFRRC